MKKQIVKIEGIEYSVSSTTESGLKKAIRSLKKSLKKNKEDKDV